MAFLHATSAWAISNNNSLVTNSTTALSAAVCTGQTKISTCGKLRGSVDVVAGAGTPSLYSIDELAFVRDSGSVSGITPSFFTSNGVPSLGSGAVNSTSLACYVLDANPGAAGVLNYTCEMSSLACNALYRYHFAGSHTTAGAVEHSNTNTTATSMHFYTTACTPSAGTLATSTQTTASVTVSMPKGALAQTVTAEYGTTTAYGSSATMTGGSVTAGSGSSTVTANVTGLTCGTTYHIRFNSTTDDSAVNGSTTINGTDATFSSSPCGPIVTTGASSAIGMTTATIGGTVDDNTYNTTAIIVEYGPTTAYGSQVNMTPNTLAGGTGATAVSANLTGLTCNATYHYRVSATGNSVTVTGNDATFNTAAVCTTVPVATTGSASNIKTDSATLSGTVNDGNGNTTVTFDYGTSTSYGTNVAATTGGSINAGAGTTAASVVLSNLQCGTTYNFRIKGVNSAGTGNGSNATFATGACANPFNPGGTETVNNIVGSSGVNAVSGSGIVTNIPNLDNRVGVADNGVVVVLNNDVKEPIKIKDNPPSNVLFSFPEDKPVDVQVGGQTFTIKVDGENQNNARDSILATNTFTTSDGAKNPGFNVLQGQAFVGNSQPSSLLGGLTLSKDNTLQNVVVETGTAGSTAGFLKNNSDKSGSVSAESGDVKVFVTPAAGANRFEATQTITLKAGEVARFNSQGQLVGVYLGSLSGSGGKSGDLVSMSVNGVMGYPKVVRFDASNVIGRFGATNVAAFQSVALGGNGTVKVRADGSVTLEIGGRRYAGLPIGSIEVLGSSSTEQSKLNADGTYNLVAGGVRYTFAPAMEDVSEFATYLADTYGFTTSVDTDGKLLVWASDGVRFYAGRPRFAMEREVSDAPGLHEHGDQISVTFVGKNGVVQTIDPSFYSFSQLSNAASKAGWTVNRADEIHMTATSPSGQVYDLLPVYRMNVLQSPFVGQDLGNSFFSDANGQLYFKTLVGFGIPAYQPFVVR
ncbi:beta strand repeat-containing protein [Parachitinimonas caeni]|uniref:Fibronectin type-III domain-containing protein n=1 Tax=Parachitinimonas caeni TaxID=3031301 RepID=A0ABT7DTQ1_9NEIS|nr:hypothetical protein [Parachitinimonas caeni]MDK2123435.1 hypothetical protein [Parachitinimonas caeni]